MLMTPTAPLILDLCARDQREAPFRHVHFPQLLAAEQRARVRDEILAARAWQRNEVRLYRYDGLNVASHACDQGGVLRVLLELLSSQRMCDALAGPLGAPRCRLNSLFAHRMLTGDSVGLHVDADHESDRYRLVIYPGCAEDFVGGQLHLYGGEGDTLTVKRTLACRDGEAFLFGFGRDSFHSVQRVIARNGVGRLSVVATYGETT